jgi:YaiO family outer membrane protein
MKPARCVLALVTALACPVAHAQSTGAASSGAFTDVGASIRHERPDNGTPLWTERAVDIVHQYAPRKVALARTSRVERFGLSDSTLSAGGYLPLGEGTTAFVEAGASDRHVFLYRHYAQAQVAQSLGNGWGFIGGVKRLEYNLPRVDVLDLTLERYFGNWRAAFTALPSHSSTAGHGESYRALLSRYYGERNSVSLVLFDGTEVDRPTGPGVILATPVTGFELYGRHWLDASWALEYAAGRVDHGTVTRRTLTAGLRYRF